MYTLNDKALDLNFFEGLDEREVVSQAEQALEHPSESAWLDDELWETHTLMFSTPDIELTDDYLVDYSNYRKILDALQADYPDDVESASFGHWTYSRFVAIKIRVLDERGRITPAFVKALAITEALSDYPIFDEDDFSALELEAQQRTLTEWAEYVELDPAIVLECWSAGDFDVYGYGSNFGTSPSNDDELKELIIEAHERRERIERERKAGQVVLTGLE